MRNDRVAILIKRASLITEKLSNKMLAQYNLSTSQYKIMVMLYNYPDKTIRQIDIEEMYSLTNPTVTGIIQNLERKNLIVREQNPDDKRSKVLCLTEKAYEMKEELLSLGETVEKQITESLTNEEHKELCFLLNKMIDGKR